MLNKNINLNKNETESEMENPTHSFREIGFYIIYKSRVKSKTDDMEHAKEKAMHFVRKNFF